jgi:MscS family membrane protein
LFESHGGFFLYFWRDVANGFSGQSISSAMNAWLQREFLDNTIGQYLIFLGILMVIILFRGLIVKVLTRLLNRLYGRISPSDGTARLGRMLRGPLSLFILLVALILALNALAYPEVLKIERYGRSLQEVLLALYKLCLILSFTWLAARMIDFLGIALRERAAKTATKQDDQLVFFIKDSFKVLLYILALFLVLGSVFNLDITSLIAGAGLAGLAVALAAQDSLRNLLGSLTIFSEKPFTVGDVIEIGGTIGVVEKVGFRSTVMRSPDKTRIVMPNKRVVDEVLNNLSDRPMRRVFFLIRLQYGATAAQVRAIVTDIQALLRGEDDVLDLPSVAFEGFQSDGLELRVDYNLSLVDWQPFLRKREMLNLGIMEIVERHGGEFAGKVLNVELTGGAPQPAPSA